MNAHAEDESYSWGPEDQILEKIREAIRGDIDTSDIVVNWRAPRPPSADEMIASLAEARGMLRHLSDVDYLYGIPVIVDGRHVGYLGYPTFGPDGLPAFQILPEPPEATQ